MTINQISVFVENKAGRLAEITDLLGKNGVDLRAMSIADTSDFGILRVIVDDPQKALDALSGSGCIVTVTPVIAAKIDDQPGGLAFVLKILSDADISIEYLYAFVSRKSDGAYVVLRVEDTEAACRVLNGNDVSVASPEELYNI